jgi:hypothetical protein
MLVAARKQLRVQLATASQARREAQQAYKELVRARNGELQSTLVKHLVYTQLDTVPGIGSTLKSRILRWVFQGELTDLYQAYRLDRIGPQCQQAINRWVQRVELQLPELLQEDFPGKADILATYQDRLDTRRRQADAAEQRAAELEELERRVEAALVDLETVTWHDFHEALVAVDGPTEKVRRHILGVFAAWEPMPEWFRQALSIEEA